MATATRTHTFTYTKTLEEKAVLAALSVRRNSRDGRWTMEEIAEMVHENHKGTHEAAARGMNDDPLVDVEDWLTPVIVGQLIERGLIWRTGSTPERYLRVRPS